MQIEDYFNFLAEDDIRMKGTRVGIETVLHEYIHNSQTPEAIADIYYTLTLEQVYATILYYLQNQEKVGAYLEDYLEYCRSEISIMLCAEPSIHGGKKSKCDLDAELAILKKKRIPFPSWYVKE